MADFRRSILAFAVVALLLGLIPTASAQGVNGVQCIANSGVPPTVRAEGLTELVGDIVLNCSGGTPISVGNVIPQANITIFLNTQVTSRLLNSPQSEAILTIDEPTVTQTSASQTCTSISGCQAVAAGPGVPNANEFKQAFLGGTGTPCSTTITQPPVGAGGGAINPATCYINPNVFQGSVAGNSVSFVGIPIDPPGSQGTRIYRITNLRANATIPAPGGSGTPGQIIALISATPATNPGTGTTSTFSINNPTQIIGFVQTSLATSITGFASNGTSVGTGALGATDIAIRQCIGKTVSPQIGFLNFAELFPTAFKTRTTNGAGAPLALQNTLGLTYNSESGYYNTNLASPAGDPLGTSGGLADYGTRLKAVFNNVPNGVSIFVAVNNTPFTVVTAGTTGNVQTTTAAALTSGETTVGFTPISATSSGSATPNGIWQVPLVNGSGTAVWEVTAANPLVSQTYSFAYYTVATASPATNSPAVGTGTVNLSYAPTPPSFTAAAGAVASAGPIPRFIDTSTATNAISVTICRTNLLFPFVTNTSGFDTGLAISNTSTDPFGTAAQQGPCTLNFYGSNAPAAVTTANVASGTTYTNLASLAAPNFQGYVIAVCSFQYAHGFAFVSDLGARNLAMGYLALIIPDPPRSAVPFECANAISTSALGTSCVTSGEQLGY